jgi:hypothetical protein
MKRVAATGDVCRCRLCPVIGTFIVSAWIDGPPMRMHLLRLEIIG